MHVTRRFLLAGGVVAGAALGSMIYAQSTPEGAIYAENGIAVDGTDVVGYFREGRPVLGKAEFSVNWMGAEWRFASAETRDLFAADPEAYAPQYGGFCAWAVSQGYTASTVPEAWRIVDGKLYLNFSPRIQRRWEQDIPGHIAAGDANWPGLRAMGT